MRYINLLTHFEFLVCVNMYVGVSREVDNLIQENTELLATKYVSH